MLVSTSLDQRAVDDLRLPLVGSPLVLHVSHRLKTVSELLESQLIEILGTVLGQLVAQLLAQIGGKVTLSQLL